LTIFFGVVGRTATAQGGSSVETFSVTEARPVAEAMNVIEERYGVLIDYVDPQYAGPQDTERVSYRPGRVTVISESATVK
jgi:hypothetical protein